MDTKQRKVGRPKAPTRTGPLVLGEDRGRAKVTLEISELAAGELAEYARWVEQYSGMAANEARFKTVDFALRETFRRDRVWQAHRRSSGSSRTTPPVASTPAAPPRTTPVNSPSLPPPTAREPRTNPDQERR
jgi:hypothetical protein